MTQYCIDKNPDENGIHYVHARGCEKAVNTASTRQLSRIELALAEAHKYERTAKARVCILCIDK